MCAHCLHYTDEIVDFTPDFLVEEGYTVDTALLVLEVLLETREAKVLVGDLG